MGWIGNWEIKYNGNDSEKFANLAKLIIPNYIKRFEETEKGKLECLRNLSWYEADVDISKMMQYLSETDTIDVRIDGESHPILRKRRISEKEALCDEKAFEENGRYYVYDELDYEEQTFKKKNGKVVIDNKHPDKDRPKCKRIGVLEMFIYEMKFPESAYKNEQKGEISTVNSYIKYIAQQFAGKDDFMPIVQDFIYDVLDSKKLRDMTTKRYNWLKLDEKKLDKIAGIREQFKTVESTKSYLEEVKKQNPETEKKTKSEPKAIPNFIANMSKRDINNLGGLERLLKLVEVKGESSTKEILSLLGYEINDSKTKESPSLEDLEFEQTLLERQEKQVKQLHQQYEQQLSDREENISIDK